MLQKLIIRNYAIIGYLSIEPDAHLNIVTGETGAGKSIILGALSLILGERADTSVLINKEEKCIVEAFFDVSDNKIFKAALTDAELDEDAQCIIRREIGSNGKSRAFINDTPVTLTLLNNLTSLLVDLHQQFDQLAVRDNEFQMEVLDIVANNKEAVNEYGSLFYQYEQISAQLKELTDKQQQFQKEADYKQYLLDELLQVNFKNNEIEDVEQQLKQLSHAENIRTVLQAGYSLLEEGEQPLTNELKRINQQLQNIVAIFPDVLPLSERISSAHAELKDIADEINLLENKINTNNEQMLLLQERIDIGYKLLKKHAVQTTADLLQIQEQLSSELKATLDLDEAIQKLQQERDLEYRQLRKKAEKISGQRKKIAPQLAIRINELLKLVGMPNAVFNILVQPLKEISATGVDTIIFMLDANKSGQFLPVYKAASGGEMSRIMLSIKSITAEAMQMPVLIFDEVDTGISGEAAKQVALLLKDLSKYHQVICITHQAQVAAKATRHFYVYKEAEKNGRINTKLRVLPEEERVTAIAKMIGGEEPSNAALQNARELLN